MEICNRKHIEIVFEGLPCPMCEAVDNSDVLYDKVANLEDKLEFKDERVKYKGE